MAERRLCVRPVGCGGARGGGTVHERSTDLLQARHNDSQEPDSSTLWVVGHAVSWL